ncbi:hypothetical protein AB832_01575 [Flavobacteriaceae bacterium (ex Bugula neritina AB1)]|nr:hypothetical protein AB832_01575 [Flavobacteriaceae bacterium (ex Bugula neritina AB1)]
MTSLDLTTPLVTVDWLLEHIDHPDLVVLDASIKKVTSTENNDNLQIQIPGARFFDIKNSFSDLHVDVPNMLASPKVFEENCRKIGIKSTSKIIVYDTLGIYSSPRAWWMFRAMGIDTVAVLDGGLPEWIKSGYPTENRGVEENYDAGDLKVNDRSKYMVSAKDIISGMTDPNVRILDARSIGRFKGIEPEPRAGLKGGHIPNSINLPYTKVLNNGKMLPVQTLNEIFDDFDIENKKLIFSCGSGITACIILLAAKLSGYKNLSVYDGSWSEWGQLKNVPIVC